MLELISDNAKYANGMHVCLNKIPMFYVGWNSNRQKGSVGDEWKMTSRLPGFDKKVWYLSSTDSALKKAEALFAMWLDTLGLEVKNG